MRSLLPITDNVSLTKKKRNPILIVLRSVTDTSEVTDSGALDTLVPRGCEPKRWRSAWRWFVMIRGCLGRAAPTSWLLARLRIAAATTVTGAAKSFGSE